MRKHKILFILLFLFAGCASAPEEVDLYAEDRRTEDQRNEPAPAPVQYKADPNLPVRKISGKVWCGEGLTRKSANSARIELKWQNQLVAAISTGADGNYTLSAPLKPEAIYLLTAKGSCGSYTSELRAEEKDYTGINMWLEK